MTTRAVPFGKYHLLERVNVGGMAEVYKAKMVGVEGFEKLLAIKRILPAIAADKDFITMFIDEAKISVQLTHANIAQTFELGRIGDTYYIAMEYVPGRDLRALFDRLRRRGEVVPPELACYAMSRVAEGLDYAHRKRDAKGRELGIIHRDISPQNVLVSYEGEVKLIDFGIAKAANKMMKTQAGILKGKFGYMSPEQVRGVPLDRRSDIFAVGIVLHELLVGERLFVGESDYSVLEKVRSASVPRPSNKRRSVTPQLEKIVMRALAKNPDDRYQHASELVADLQRYLLAQERLFTREDLAAFIKAQFPDEWESEKRSQLESSGDDRTPTGPAAIELAEPSLGGKTRPGLEGAAARPSAPPPPVAAASARRESPLRPRLAQAALAAETEKVRVLPQEHDIVELDDHDEVTATATQTDSSAEAITLPPDERTPLSTTRSLVPPRPAPTDEEIIVGDLPTRVGKPATSRPPRPPARSETVEYAEPSEPTPRAIGFGDEDDERTSSGENALVRNRGGRSPGAISIADETDESTAVQPPSGAHSSPRGSQWAIVPIAGALAALVGYLALAAVQHRWPFNPVDRIEENPIAQAVAGAASEVPKGALIVITEPHDAQVLIDDEPAAKSAGDPNVTREHLEANVTYVVLARQEGYADARQEVELREGERREVRLTLRPLNAVLTVRSTPIGGRVFVDGRDFGRTPQSLATLEPGAHSLRLELKCYRTFERPIVLAGDVAVNANLEPMPGACLAARPVKTNADPGTLRIVATPPARVYIDDRDTGRLTPLTPGIQLPPGPHHVRLVAGAAEREFDVTIEPGKLVTKIEVLR